LDGLPTKVLAEMVAVLDAVAEAPPPAFSGGGKWEAMHGELLCRHPHGRLSRMLNRRTERQCHPAGPSVPSYGCERGG
jgi:hypothetical protein